MITETRQSKAAAKSIEIQERLMALLPPSLVEKVSVDVYPIKGGYTRWRVRVKIRETS